MQLSITALMYIWHSASDMPLDDIKRHVRSTMQAVHKGLCRAIVWAYDRQVASAACSADKKPFLKNFGRMLQHKAT
jgi:hypothetical protein